MSVVQCITAHSRRDTRVRDRQVTTLRDALNVKVALFVQDGLGNEIVDGETRVYDTGLKPPDRLRRVTLGAGRMWYAVARASPKIAHFHDPEFLPWALLLRMRGMKVIYDVHEDYPQAARSRPYLPKAFRPAVAFAFSGLEWVCARAFDAVVAATPAIAERFPPHKTVLVQNFPILQELVAPEPTDYSTRPPHFAYIGGITAIRGTAQMIEGLAHLTGPTARLQLAGKFVPASYEADLSGLPGWERVDFLGWADRPAVARLLGNVRAGLVLFLPEPNHVRAQPNKMFEYMAAGLPVIASDFPLWREIVEGAGCGLLVDPEDPAAIAGAMQWILDNPEEAEAMGRRGREAVETRYNWDAEAEKLVALYRRLLDREATG